MEDELDMPVVAVDSQPAADHPVAGSCDDEDDGSSNGSYYSTSQGEQVGGNGYVSVASVIVDLKPVVSPQPGLVDLQHVVTTCQLVVWLTLDPPRCVFAVVYCPRHV